MLWLKALHLIFVVCWFAGIFYLPRILVHYAGSENPAVKAHLAMMARKLYRFVTPFMVLTVGLGLAMVGSNPSYYFSAKWLWVKIALVMVLIAYHLQCGRYVKEANEETSTHGHVFFRFFNGQSTHNNFCEQI